MNTTKPAHERLRSLAENKEYSDLEDAWLEAITQVSEGPEGRLDRFLSSVDLLISRGEKERSCTLLDLLLPLVSSGGAFHPTYGARGRVEVLKRRVVSAPQKVELRVSLIAAFREAYPGDTLVDCCIELAQLQLAPDPAKALQLLGRLLHFRPGAYVNHGSGWGVGVVDNIDAPLRQVTVNLEKKAGHRLDLKVAAEILEPLAADHFLALAIGGGERLRKLAESDPVELIRVLLSSFGNPLTLKQLKFYLQPTVITVDGWAKWWNRTKVLLRDSGYYRIADKAPHSVEKLPEAINYEDEVLRQFTRAPVEERLAQARKLSREKGAQMPRLKERVLEELRAIATKERGPEAIEAAMVLERLDGPGSGARELFAAALRAAPKPADAILAIEGVDEKRRAAESLQEILGEGWIEPALELFSRGDDGLRDGLLPVLEKAGAGDRAIALVTEAIRVPKNFPDLFVWAVRRYLEGDDSAYTVPVRAYRPQEVLGRVFDAMDHLSLRLAREGKASIKDAITRTRNLLTIKSSKFFREVIKPLAREEARLVYQRVLSSSGLSEPLRVELIEIIMARYPDIIRAEAVPIWEEPWIYVTEPGLLGKQAEFRELTEEKLPKNFQDIGRAAAFGDLSENAEYTSALEERDRLTKRATEMKDQLDKVRMISPEMLKEGEVTLGARVRLVNATTGQEVTYNILGPWDGSPDQGVLSYRSPLAIPLLGTKVGDEVEAQLPGGVERFRVLEVGSAFAKR